MINRKIEAIFRWAAIIGMTALAAPAYSQQLFFDDFESGGMGTAQNSVQWGGNRQTTVSRDISRSGSYSLKFQFEAEPSGGDSFSEQRFSLGNYHRELFIEWYAYYPNGTEGLGARYVHRDDTGADNNKLIRVWADDYTNFPLKAGASTLPGSDGSNVIGEYGWDGGGVGIGPYDAPNAPSISNFISSAQLGRWVKFKFHVKAATPGQSDGVIEFWRDDVKLGSSTNLALYSHEGRTSAFNHGYLLGWANSGFSQATNIYIDDVRISTSDSTGPIPRAPGNLIVE